MTARVSGSHAVWHTDLPSTARKSHARTVPQRAPPRELPVSFHPAAAAVVTLFQYLQKVCPFLCTCVDVVGTYVNVLCICVDFVGTYVDFDCRVIWVQVRGGLFVKRMHVSEVHVS